MTRGIDDLYEKYEALLSRLEQLERRQPSSTAGAAIELEVVNRITREAFGMDAIFKLEHEGECEGSYIVVEVPALGTVEEVHMQSETWHKEVARHRPVLSTFALSLKYNE